MASGVNAARLDEYFALKERKKVLDDEVKGVNAEIRALEETLLEQLADAGQTSVTQNGQQAYRWSTLYASMAEGGREALVEALIADGHRELATVNHQTFSSWVRERLEQWCEATGTRWQDAVDRSNDGDFDWTAVLGEAGRYVKVSETVKLNVRRAGG